MALKLFCKLFSELARNAIAGLQMLKYDISTLLDIGMCHLMLSVMPDKPSHIFGPPLSRIVNLLLIY